jgi:AAA+ ATPase superfamily predicted ATPase
MSLFINRELELAALERFYAEKGSQLVIIWGRRRVGKTELVKQFVKDKPNYIYMAKVLPTQAQIDNFLKGFCESISEPVPRITDWKGAFEFVLNKLKTKRKVVIAVDEFPYAIQGDAATLSYFQELWDNFLSKRQDIMLILLGSTISMMESYVLGYRSPLYGRRTGQIKLEKLGLRHVRKFFPTWSLRDVIYAYSILDGIPAYLLNFDPKLDIWVNVKKNFLDFSRFLSQEPQILIKEELREPVNYMSILEAIANMNFKLIDIANAIQMPAYNLPKYLRVLEELGFIKRIVPVTAKKPKVRDTLYKFADNYLNFYFRYIHPRTTEINAGKIDFVLDHIRKDIDFYVGKFIFEKICEEFLQLKPPFQFERIGPFWKKDVEIDRVVINEHSGDVGFVECKWSDKVDGVAVLDELKSKSSLVPLTGKKEHYIIFAKSFKRKVAGKGVYYFDINDIEKVLK